MHIVEVDERLDYGRFWKGRESTTEAGHAFWEIAQGLADSYPCPPCKPVAQALIHGGHDVVNLHLGKPVHTPDHLERLFQIIHEAEHKYEHTKRHKVEQEHG